MRWINNREMPYSEDDTVPGLNLREQLLDKLRESKVQREHEEIHAAQVREVLAKKAVKEITPTTKIVLDITPKVVNISCSKVDLYFPIPGVAGENIDVSYGYYTKDIIIVKCLNPTPQRHAGAEVEFRPYTIDLKRGQLMHFDIDYARDGIMFLGNGLLRIALKRELEVKNKPTLKLHVKGPNR